MLEQWIIEEIRRREEDERHRNQRPQLEVPLWPEEVPGVDRDERGDEQPQRGVVIIGM